VMQQKQHSAVDSRRRLTNIQMLVSHSVSAVLKKTVYLLLNVKSRLLKMYPETCQFAEDAVKISNIFWILNFNKAV